MLWPERLSDTGLGVVSNSIKGLSSRSAGRRSLEHLLRFEPVIGIVLGQPLPAGGGKHGGHPVPHQDEQHIVDLPADLLDSIEQTACCRGLEKRLRAIEYL